MAYNQADSSNIGNSACWANSCCLLWRLSAQSYLRADFVLLVLVTCDSCCKCQATVFYFRRHFRRDIHDGECGLCQLLVAFLGRPMIQVMAFAGEMSVAASGELYDNYCQILGTDGQEGQNFTVWPDIQASRYSRMKAWWPTCCSFPYFPLSLCKNCHDGDAAMWGIMNLSTVIKVFLRCNVADVYSKYKCRSTTEVLLEVPTTINQFTYTKMKQNRNLFNSQQTETDRWGLCFEIMPGCFTDAVETVRPAGGRHFFEKCFWNCHHLKHICKLNTLYISWR